MRIGRAFTLIEVMIVVVVLGVLAAIALVSYRTTIRNAQQRQAGSNLEMIVSAADIFRLNNGSFPAACAPSCAGSAAVDGVLNTNFTVTSPQWAYDLDVIGAGAGQTVVARATFVADNTRVGHMSNTDNAPIWP